MQRTPPKTITRLSAKQMFRLMELVKSDYAEKEITDGAFAEYATAVLQFPCNSNHVMHCRETFDIPSTKMRGRAVGKDVTSRIAALEAAILSLEHRYEVLIEQVKHCRTVYK